MICLFSGLSVQNPNSAQRIPGGNMVRDLLRRAAEYVLSSIFLFRSYFSFNRGGPAPAPTASNVFRGSGHMLGSEDLPSSVVPDSSTSACTVSSLIRLTNILKAIAP